MHRTTGFRAIVLATFGWLWAIAANAQPFYPIPENQPYPIEGVENQEGTGSITQGNDGLVYIGLPTGVLVMRGDNTDTVSTPNRVTTLAVDTLTGRVYVGLQNGFGYLAPRADGGFQYISIYKPDDVQRQLDATTKIFFLSDQIGFYSYWGLLLYNRENFELVKNVNRGNQRFFGAFQINQSIFLNTDKESNGLLEYKGGNESYTAGNQNAVFKGQSIVFSRQLTQFNTLIGLSDRSVWLVKGSPAQMMNLIDARRGEALGLPVDGVVSARYFIIATRNNGCYLLRTEAGGQTTTLVNRLSTRTGFLENDINGMLLDNFGRLWLTHKRTYSMVYLNLPINQYKQFNGRINSMQYHQGRLYVATDDGVYFINDSPESFIARRMERQAPAQPTRQSNRQNNRNTRRNTRPAPARTDTDGDTEVASTVYNIYEGWEYERVNQFQTANCYQLFVWKGTLYVATDKGVFKVGEGNRRPVIAHPCHYVHFRSEADNTWMLVDRESIRVYRATDDEWESQGSIPLAGSISEILSIEQDNTGQFWLLTPDSLCTFNTAASLNTPRSLRGMVRLNGRGNTPRFQRVGNSLYAVIGNKVYTLADKKSVPFRGLQGAGFRGRNNKVILAGAQFHLWVLRGNSLISFKRSQADLQQEYDSNILALLPDADLAYYDGTNGLWIACRNALYKISEPVEEPAQNAVTYETFITGIVLNGNSFWGQEFTDRSLSTTEEIELPYGTDYVLDIRFFSPTYLRAGLTQYLYRFSEDDRWTRSTDPHALFNVPGSGTFQFQVKAYDPLTGKSSQVRTFQFSVATPPWLQPWAFVVYALFAIGAIWGYSRYSQRRVRKRNEWLQTEVNRQTEEIQKQRDELSQRNGQLVTSMETIQQQQDQLVSNERMVLLGSLAANVAHELNTPLGAIKGSAQNMATILPNTLRELPRLSQTLTPELKPPFEALLKAALVNNEYLPSREERRMRDDFEHDMAAAGIPHADVLARHFVKIGYKGKPLPEFAALLCHPEAELILRQLAQVAIVCNSVQNVANSAEKMEREVFKLKNSVYQPNAGDNAPPALTDVAASIENTLNVYQNLILQGIDLTKEFAIRPTLMLREHEFAQVWTNILVNAIHAMKGQGALKVSIRPEGDAWVRIGIMDNGPGIPPDIQEKIFEHLFTTKPKGEGTGMGLDICRRVVQNHGGTLTVESVPGQTEFIIRLPMQ